MSPGFHRSLNTYLNFFSSSRQAKLCAHKECKLFAFAVSGLGGILTACKNFPLKCKLLTSQSFHLFYLLMCNLNK